MFSAPSASAGCPVKFGAQIDSRLVARSIADEHKNPNSQILKVTFDRVDSPTVVNASITVHGFSPSSRLLPVEQHSEANKTQTFELKSGPGLDLSQTDLKITGLALVRWAEVTELRFSDGSTWHKSASEQCSATPSGFRLVGLSSK
jgi:hypothetical protein